MERIGTGCNDIAMALSAGLFWIVDGRIRIVALVGRFLC